MPAGFSGHCATRVDVWVPMPVAMRDVPGWDLDAFRNVVSLLARVEPGADATAAAQATRHSSAASRSSASSGGEVASAERRIA